MSNDKFEERERQLAELARTLPRDAAPPPEAWDAIHAQITEDARARATAAGVAAVGWWQRPQFLAAAAVLLVALSAAVTATAVLWPSDQRAVGPAVATSGGRATLAEFTARENDYLEHVNVLLAALNDESLGLSPETIATIRTNLLVIDAAILDARRALTQDPANNRLVEILASTYEKKLDLLRRTTAMARSG